MAVDEIVLAAVPALERKHAVLKLLGVVAERSLIRVEGSRRYLDDTRLVVDIHDLRRIGFNTAREDVHRMRTLSHLTAELTNVDVHAAAISCSGAGKRRRMNRNDGDVTHSYSRS